MLLMKAAHASGCDVCKQTVRPETMIWLLTRGYGRTPGRSAHQGCVWEQNPVNGPAPHLTWEQLDALPKAIQRLTLPDDIWVDRLIGAVRGKLAERLPIGRRNADAALALGPDLLTAYWQVITRLETSGHIARAWWQPVQANGQKWVDPAERPTPTAPTKADQAAHRDETMRRQCEMVHRSFERKRAANPPTA